MGGIFGPSSMERLSDHGRQVYVDHFEHTPIEAAEEVQSQELTDNSTGTAGLVIGPIGDTMAVNQGPAINDNFASLTAQVNANRLSLIARSDMLTFLNLSGDNIASAVISRYPKGGFLTETGIVTNDEVLLIPAAGRRLAVGYNTSRCPYYALMVDKQASVDEMVFKAGLALTSALDTVTDDDQAYFKYLSATSPNLFVGVSVANVDTVRDTGIPFAAAELGVLEIVVDENRVPRFYLTRDGGGREEVGRTGAGAGFMPALTAGVQLFPHQGIETLAAAGSAELAWLGLSVDLLATN